MIQKRIVPQSSDFGGQEPIQILKVGSKGLDKSASMQKRAAAFDDIIADLKPMPKKAYLHVITTGAMQHFGINRNCFVAGTSVVTQNGAKAIEHIRVGDLVQGGSGQMRRVNDTSARWYTGQLVTLTAKNGQIVVTMTQDHPVLVLDASQKWGDFIAAKDIKPGAKLLVPDAKVTQTALKYNVTVDKVQFTYTESTIVYDLKIGVERTFCVPFVVHNCDGWNQDAFVYRPPMPKNASCKQIQLDGGLKKYHSTYLDKAAVYQEHQTDKQKSGQVKAAVYNDKMHRGQLLIQVDTDKWAQRLNKKANGQDIFLSVGASLKNDYCTACGNAAHTLDQHCQHIKKHAGMVLSDGTKIGMINDAPKFYDISGVNVPADQMAFVLRKVASGDSAAKAIEAARFQATRPPMALSKAARLLGKLAQLQKCIQCQAQDDPIFADSPEAVEDFLKAVQNYDADQIIDQCNRKAILLSPEMLFKILGKESDNPQLFNIFAQSCPCSGQHLMQDMQQDQEFKPMLGDGSFDSVLPVDLALQDVLKQFIPQFGVSRPALNGKAIRIQITSTQPQKDMREFKDKLQDSIQDSESSQDSDSGDRQNEDSDKEEDMQKKASLVGDQFRRTYARYVLSFAQRNSQDTCMLAMQKIARYK